MGKSLSRGGAPIGSGQKRFRRDILRRQPMFTCRLEAQDLEDFRNRFRKGKGPAVDVVAIIADTKSVEDVAITFELAKILRLVATHMLGQAAKFTKNLELQLFGHPRQLRCAGGVENDLEWAHRKHGIQARLSRKRNV